MTREAGKDVASMVQTIVWGCFGIICVGAALLVTVRLRSIADSSGGLDEVPTMPPPVLPDPPPALSPGPPRPGGEPAGGHGGAAGPPARLHRPATPAGDFPAYPYGPG